MPTTAPVSNALLPCLTPPEAIERRLASALVQSSACIALDRAGMGT